MNKDANLLKYGDCILLYASQGYLLSSGYNFLSLITSSPLGSPRLHATSKLTTRSHRLTSEICAISCSKWCRA